MARSVVSAARPVRLFDQSDNVIALLTTGVMNKSTRMNRQRRRVVKVVRTLV
jgi:hypothetical protein